MAVFDKNTKVPITCPKCGSDCSKTLGWLQANPEFPCGASDCPVVFQTEELLEGFRDANRQMDNFVADMKKMFK